MTGANKLATLVMATALVLSMTACSVAPANSSSTPATDNAPSSPPKSSSSQAFVAPEREYVKGVTTGREYVNQYWGIKFVAPSDEIMLATPEQVSELLGFGTDAMGTDAALLEQLQQHLDTNELCAVDMATGSTMMLICLELPMSGISAEIYIKGIVESATASAGNTTFDLDNDGEFVKETIAGKEFTTVSYTVKGENIPDNHQTHRLLIDGKRALMITSTYPPAIEAAKASQEALLAAVTALEQVAP